MATLVTFGETMALLSTPTFGMLRHAHSLILGAAGAESNVAVGARRLGMTAAWIGRVGDDEFGRLVLGRLLAEGVEVHAGTDLEAPTGLMIKEQRTSAITRVSYYRRGSAGSRISPEDIQPDLVRSANVLHLTGITPALSASARAATYRAIELAQDAEVDISFDVNYRQALWTAEDAAPVLRDLARRASVVFASQEEAVLVTGLDDPVGAAEKLQSGGARCAVVRLGGRGAVASTGQRPLHQPAIPVQAVDSVGAGDAFVAAYLWRQASGADVPECLSAGATAGAFSVSTPGDWEGMPEERELRLLAGESGQVHR